MVFERFTDQARRAVELATDEARERRHGFVGAEDLLAGVSREDDDGVAAAALGVPAGLAFDRIGPLIPPGDTGWDRGAHVPFTAQAKKSLDASLRDSLRLGSNCIDRGHLLLGVLDTPGESVDAILSGIGVRRVDARQRVLERLAAPGSSSAASQGGRGWAPAPQTPGDHLGAARLIAEMVRQRDALGAALRRYGRHEDACEAPVGPCTCGLDEAIDAVTG